MVTVKWMMDGEGARVEAGRFSGEVLVSSHGERMVAHTRVMTMDNA